MSTDKNDRVWSIMTTIICCLIVMWATDTDGRYLQQAALVIAGLIMGALLGGE